MEQVLAEMQIKNQPEPQAQELNEIRAQIFSAAGAVILGATVLVTIFLFFSFFFPALEGMQTIVVIILAFICWGYLLNSFTEKLKLTDQTLEFSAFLSRRQNIQLNEVLGFKLSDFGLNMSGDRYAFEISIVGKNKPVVISLGPCWDKAQLTAFINAFGKKLESA